MEDILRTDIDPSEITNVEDLQNFNNETASVIDILLDEISSLSNIYNNPTRFILANLPYTSFNGACWFIIAD